MTLIRHFSKLAYVQSVVGMIAYGLATQNAAMVLVAVTLCAISWSVVESSEGRPLPRWLINTAVGVVTVWLFYTQMVGYQPLIYNLGLYILFLQLCKLYERKTNRDWAQLIVLSLMQMICGAIVSNRVAFAVMLVGIWCWPWLRSWRCSSRWGMMLPVIGSGRVFPINRSA